MAQITHMLQTQIYCGKYIKSMFIETASIHNVVYT
ncbi:hypothetical protein SAMN04488696_2328 [Methanolobus profundi]|uniref:Uncharacterized protein n=1 Tax=Methanolobus profundi TaxID=487685 RepID=A0A1I4TLG8_9EURY|nr:hypothetical protein SAMN04488696_2328 [Methanolobus profundi]